MDIKSVCCVVAIATTVLTSFNSIAYSQDGDVCEKIIQHGLNNISLKTNVEASTDRLYWRFCDEKYESMSEAKKLEFGVTIKAIPFSLGAEGSSDAEKFSKFCGDYRSSTDRFSSQSIYTNQMHDKAVDAWRSCIETTRRQMFIDFRIPTNQLYADVSLKYTGPSGKTMFNGVETSGLNCTFNGSPIDASSTFEITPAEKQIRCERNGSPQEIGGVKANYFPDGGITVKTDAGNSSIEFVSMIEGPARTRFELVDKNIADVASQIGTLRTSLRKWPDGGNVGGNGIGSGDDRGASMCPEGHYAVGVNIWGARGPVKYCIGCVDGIQIICRPLNSR